eukprot:TRINITY_DN13009_c0_g1_i2.p1 TRINITY_DN13009_c0_g1~~TRINITY_DN13009_c0_g1_i2.p1  ORF type:complete len:140 (+),score=17.75 TRINITY_DN13009_c0_g1_i2:151-570(+)
MEDSGKADLLALWQDFEQKQQELLSAHMIEQEWHSTNPTTKQRNSIPCKGLMQEWLREHQNRLPDKSELNFLSQETKIPQDTIKKTMYNIWYRKGKPRTVEQSPKGGKNTHGLFDLSSTPSVVEPVSSKNEFRHTPFGQ